VPVDRELIEREMTMSMRSTSRSSEVVRVDQTDGPIGGPPQVLLSRRSLGIALGLLWLLDGALQMQSFMFTKGFADSIIAPSAHGQPFFVAAPVEWNARLIAAHSVLLNGCFAAIQVGLGLCFLFRHTVRVAVVSSIVWAGGVWYLGEGLGGVAGGHATALIGAPGAALIYIVLAIAAWPERVPSGHNGRHWQRPPHWLLRAWALLCVGFAVLDVLPPNVSARAVSTQLTTNASMAPSWLAAADHWFATWVHAAGSMGVVAMAGLEIAVGVVALNHHVLIRKVGLSVGIGIAGIYWAIGQSFGQLFSGQATDPNTGPLLIVFGMAAMGATLHSSTSRAQATYIAQPLPRVDQLAA